MSTLLYYFLLPLIVAIIALVIEYWVIQPIRHFSNEKKARLKIIQQENIFPPPSSFPTQNEVAKETSSNVANKTQKSSFTKSLLSVIEFIFGDFLKLITIPPLLISLLFTIWGILLYFNGFSRSYNFIETGIAGGEILAFSLGGIVLSLGIIRGIKDKRFFPIGLGFLFSFIFSLLGFLLGFVFACLLYPFGITDIKGAATGGFGIGIIVSTLWILFLILH
jgi:hypothetical protein